MDIILQSLQNCQQKGGFEWNLKYKNVWYPTKMLPVIILIVGDAQGNHKLCGMYNSFYGTSRVNHRTLQMKKLDLKHEPRLRRVGFLE